jgi:predicted Zn-dependent protease
MRTNTIEPPDSHHLNAAEGWVELSVFDEAQTELTKIRPEFRNHPDVVEMCWIIAAKARQWPQALALARKMARLAPEEPNGWAYEASSLIELHRPLEAYSLLLEAQQRFPDDETMAYDLGCVCCVLGCANEAFLWIRRAIDLGGLQVKRRAKDDPRLQPIWKDLHLSRACRHPD